MGKIREKEKDANKYNQVYSAESQTLFDHVIIFITVVYADYGQKLVLDLVNVGAANGLLVASFYSTN